MGTPNSYSTSSSCWAAFLAFACCSLFHPSVGADADCSHFKAEGLEVVDGLVLLQKQAGAKILSTMTEANNDTLIAKTAQDMQQGTGKPLSISMTATAANSTANLTGSLSTEHATQVSLLAVMARVRQKVGIGDVGDDTFYFGVVIILSLIPCFFIAMCWALSVTTYERKRKPPRRQHRWAPAPGGDMLVALCDRYMSLNWNMPFRTSSNPLKEFRRPPNPDEEQPPIWKSFILDSAGVPTIMITVSRNPMSGAKTLQLVEPARGRPIASVDDTLTIRDEHGTLFGQLQQQVAECPWNYKLFVAHRDGEYVPEAGKSMWEMMALGRTTDGMQLIAVSIPQNGRLLAKGKRIWGTWRDEDGFKPSEQLVFETQNGVDAVLVIAAFIAILLFEPGFNPGSMAACLDAPLGLPSKMHHLF